MLRLSRCCLYLQVHSLADITNGFGSQIEGWAVSGHCLMSLGFRIHLRWPKHPRPGNLDWQLWASALHQTFQLNSNQSLPSLYQLGDWLLPNVSTWQFQQSTMRLFHQRPDSSWSQHSILVSSRQLRILKFHFHGLDSLPPSDTVNCTVIIKSPHCILMTGFAPTVPTTPPPPPASSFSNFKEYAHQCSMGFTLGQPARFFDNFAPISVLGFGHCGQQWLLFASS